MTPALQSFHETYPVTLELPVQWGDMDALQHVNNVVYLRWFESGRIEYMNRIHFFSRMKSHNQGPILASSSIRYRVPIEFPDRVIIGVKATEYGAFHIIQEYGVFSLTKDVLTTTGEARMVMYDFNLQQKTDVPEDILQRIALIEQNVKA